MDPKVIDKIKKLLRLATSDNPHEAALALQRAMEMMLKHGITDQDIELSTVKKMAAQANVAQKPPVYVTHLATGIASLFGCRYFVGYKVSGYKLLGVINFVGIEPHQEICTYAFDVTLRKLLKARSGFLKSVPKRTKAVNKTRRADAFAFGWSIEIIGKVRKLVPACDVPNLVQVWMESQGFETGDARGLKSKGQKAMFDAIAGAIAAQKETIHAGMENRSVKALN